MAPSVLAFDMRAGGPLLDDPRLFHQIVACLCSSGHAEADVSWSESCSPPADPHAFALETIFVICNSGMHNKVARRIFERCREALREGRSAHEEFGHKGKAAAIDSIWSDRARLHQAYLDADDKLAFCRGLPWIGGITCYHLAKNFGADVAKPDTHLQKLAARHGTTPQDLCDLLAARTSFRSATIDVVLWRACAERILDPRTGSLRVAEATASPPSKPIQQELFEPVQQELFT